MALPSFGNRVETTTSGTIRASDYHSDIIVFGRASDVSTYTREGNTLIVQMKDGNTLRIENFFTHGPDFHHLVFDTGRDMLVVFADTIPQGEIAESLITLVGESTTMAMLPLLETLALGAVALAGNAIAGGSDSSSTPSTPAPEPTP
jgi:hypothetical protein